MVYMYILYGLHRAIYGIYRGIGINVLRFLGRLQNVSFRPISDAKISRLEKKSRRHRIRCNLQYLGLFAGRKCSFSAEAELYGNLAREDIAHLLSSHLLSLLRHKPVASNRSLD